MTDHAIPDPSGDSARQQIKATHIWVAIRYWWRGQTEGVDRLGVIAKVRGEGFWSPRYGFMTAMSAGIAILGLILSSPAVVIGAMLLSPLMGPIMAIGFALAIGDARWLRESVRALLLGTLVAVLFCALLVLVSPLQTVTPEIASRTRPNLFDLLIALFSALAGAYAMIRGREGTIVGVAIATALMPPLAVVGFGLATWNWTVFGGAAALFFTNLFTIALSATIMARLYGFRTNLSAKQTLYQSSALFVAFIVLAIPLGLSLRQIAWETRASSDIGGAIRDQFDRRARISQVDIDWGARPISIKATVLTPQIVPKAETLAARTLTRQLGHEITLSIDQFQVGTGSGAAEAAELAAARNDERQRMAQQRSALAAQLALVAGVSDNAVFVDPAMRRATVEAARLPDAGLAAYRALEGRVAKLVPDWQILLVPPATALPDVPLDLTKPVKPEAAKAETKSGKAPDAATKQAQAAAQAAQAEKTMQTALAKATPITLAVWAGKRIDAPIGVSGPPDGAARVVTALRAQGINAQLAEPDTPPRTGPIKLRWLAPNAPADNSATAPGG